MASKPGGNLAVVRFGFTIEREEGMDWWITGIVRRLGGQGALDNARAEIEARHFQLQQADALAERVAMLPRPTPRPLPGRKSA